MRSEDDAPTIWTNKYMFFGNVEFEVQAAPGTGIITAITFQSDDLDEIDFVRAFLLSLQSAPEC